MSEASPAIRSIVGGWNVPYRRLAPLSKQVFTYPLGKLDVYEDRLVFSVRGLLGRIVPKRVILLSAITAIEPRRGPLGGVSYVRIFHDGDQINWTSLGNESMRWLIDHLERRMDS